MGYAIQLVIYVKYTSVYMSIPNSHPSPQVTISLFSTYVTLFLFCKLVHCIISF